MKIAVWYNLPSGGAKRALFYQVRGLVARGHQVEAWRPPVADLDFSPIGSLVTEHEAPLESLSNSHRGYLGRVVDFATEHRRGLDAMQRHSAQCAAEMKAGDFDLVFATNCSKYHAPFISRHFQGRKLLYLHEPTRVLYEACPRLVWRAMPPFPPGTPALVKARHFVRDYHMNRGLREQVDHEYQNAAAFDRILVNSIHGRESALRAYGLQTQVCYPGVDTDRFRVRDLPKEPFVIGIGHINPFKNVPFVIDAIASIEGNRPRLVWIGNGGDPTYLETLKADAARKGVELDLRVNVSDEELVDLLNRATACAYAPTLEPLGFAPLEANSCGTAAVVISEGGLRETVIDGVTGYVVDPEPSQMGARIAQLMNDPALAREMGQHAAQSVRDNWAWEPSIDRLEAELEAL